MVSIRDVFYFFAPYTDARERAVGRFFKALTEESDRSQIRTELDGLLQSNIAVINLWTEYRYKGYKYLRKPRRKKLYANLQLIAEDFDRFFIANAMSPEAVIGHVHELAPHAAVDPDKLICLQTLIDYFSPTRGKYEYRKTSSFGRLLRDPSQEKLVGDCNQIVTLYIYLYSRYHDVHDLQIRALPEHVALHYKGIDVETTSGVFANYDDKEGSTLLSIEEIVSINLLDMSDAYLSTHEVAAEDVLQAARFAFILSHDREIVTRNLDAAYRRLISLLMERHNYGRALELATASHGTTLPGIVGHNGAIYEMERHNYGAARRFAQYAPKRNELIQNSWRSEGVHHYQAHRYHDAIKAFKHIGDQELVSKCYAALFFEEQKKLDSNLTTESLKTHANTIKRMHTFAKKSGNKNLIEYADNLNKHL